MITSMKDEGRLQQIMSRVPTTISSSRGNMHGVTAGRKFSWQVIQGHNNGSCRSNNPGGNIEQSICIQQAASFLLRRQLFSGYFLCCILCWKTKSYGPPDEMLHVRLQAWSLVALGREIASTRTCAAVIIRSPLPDNNKRRFSSNPHRVFQKGRLCPLLPSLQGGLMLCDWNNFPKWIRYNRRGLMAASFPNREKTGHDNPKMKRLKSE